MKYIKHQLAVFLLWIAYKLEPKFISAIANQNPTQDATYITDPVKVIASASTEPSGIVYRPTAAELNKMKEDRATREAKEAIAETIRNAPEPTI